MAAKTKETKKQGIVKKKSLQEQVFGRNLDGSIKAPTRSPAVKVHTRRPWEKIVGERRFKLDKLEEREGAVNKLATVMEMEVTAY